MPSRKVTRPDDGRIKKNLPASRRAKPKDPATLSRYQQLMEGYLTVDDLDDDEIIAGKCKDKNGKFSGRPPKTFPRELHDAMRREFKRRIDEKFQAGVDIGYAVLTDVALDRRAAAPARVSAAIHLIERGVGKVPDKVEQQIALKPYQENLEGLLVDVGEADESNVFAITTVSKEKTA